MGGKFSVLIEASSLVELKEEVAKLHGEMQGHDKQPAEESRRGRKSKTEAPVETTAPAPTPEPEEDIFGEKAQATEAPAKQYTKADVKDAVQKVVTKYGDNGVKKALEILSGLGAKNVNELHEGKYPACVEACEKLL